MLSQYMFLLLLLPTIPTTHVSSLAWATTPNSNSNSNSNSVPRSNYPPSHVFKSNGDAFGDPPPWNPSSSISPDGFLSSTYPANFGAWESTPSTTITGKYDKCRINWSNTEFRVRQVPGDGNCLFHAVACTLEYVVNATHSDMRSRVELRRRSSLLRFDACELLSLEKQRKKLRRKVFLQGEDSLPVEELVSAAAQQYNISGEEYVSSMREDSTWGGGPEIVALCNILERPIHVYELASEANSITTKKVELEFVCRRMACFGSPKFDKKEPLCILSADSRFPDIKPGKQQESGNHFMALFPQDKDKEEKENTTKTTSTTTTRLDSQNQKRKRFLRPFRKDQESQTPPPPPPPNKPKRRWFNFFL